MQTAREMSFTEGDMINVHMFSYSWVTSFLCRHKETLRTIYPEPIEHDRILDDTKIQVFFEDNKTDLESVDKRLLLNFDETMVAPGRRSFQVVCPRSVKRAVTEVAKNDEHITVCHTIFADGTAAKPGLILPKLTNLPPMDAELTEKFAWCGSAKGWITTPLFEGYLENVSI
jgi:hypothetical protein